MPATRTAARQAASRTDGATPEAGKASPARNDDHHGAFALLPGEDWEEFAKLHAAVTSDWDLRDAYERSDSGAV